MSENIVTVVSAWLFFVLMNAMDFKTLIKREEQRTQTERQAVQEGLPRLVLLEMLLFVPASAALLLLVMPVFTHNVSALDVLAKGSARERVALYALMGIISYGFPFAAVRDRLSSAVQAALAGSAKHRTAAVESGVEREDV